MSGLLDISAEQEALKVVLFEMESVDAPPMLGEFDEDPFAVTEEPQEEPDGSGAIPAEEDALRDKPERNRAEDAPPPVQAASVPPAGLDPEPDESPVLQDVSQDLLERSRKAVEKNAQVDKAETPRLGAPTEADAKQAKPKKQGQAEWQALRSMRETVNGLIGAWSQRQSVAVPQLLPIQSRYDFTAPPYPQDIVEGDGMEITRMPDATIFGRSRPFRLPKVDTEEPPDVTLPEGMSISWGEVISTWATGNTTTVHPCDDELGTTVDADTTVTLRILSKSGVTVEYANLTAGDIVPYLGYTVAEVPKGVLLPIQWGNPLLDGKVHKDCTDSDPIRGDVIIANSTPAWTRLAGATHGVLKSDANKDPGWVTAASDYMVLQRKSDDTIAFDWVRAHG